MGMITTLLYLYLFPVLSLEYLHSHEIANPLTIWNVTCTTDYHSLCPSFSGSCSRVVVDNAFTTSDITNLHQIAMKGMATKTLGGPTILDINTGFVRDSAGLENLFLQENSLFSPEEFEIYGNIIRHLKELVSTTFGVPVHFTTPTFITRLDASTPWEPSEIHDEYWHTHADQNNTAHYHFSGLLYMSTYNEDFTGGRILFYPSDMDPSLSFPEADALAEQIIEPRAGRVVMFSSGQENPHRVERLLSGQRFVLAFWFTCDPNREFEIFLDGHAHTKFSQTIKTRLEAQQKQRQPSEEKGKRRRRSREL